MNYIRHLAAFFWCVEQDDRLTPHHISLYLALFRRWNLNRFQNPISINRAEMLRMSKIGSVNTYSRCLKQLHQWKYIDYQPSHNPLKGSRVNMFIFDTTSEQVVIPLINISKQIKQETIEYNEPIQSQSKKMEQETRYGKQPESAAMQKKKSQPENSPGTPAKSKIPPPEEHVKIYFLEKEFPEVEAERFFNYYESVGWKVGGRTRMKDWKAAARNWMLNARKYGPRQPLSPRDKSTEYKPDNGKNYAEPL